MTDENQQPDVEETVEVNAEQPNDEAVEVNAESQDAEETVADEQEVVDPAVALEQTKTELARVTKALSETQARAQAEVQNIRRRLEMDVAKARKFALERFGKDILSVADSLERGLSSMNADDDALKPAREGMELTLKQLLDVFGRYQIEQIAPQAGEPFDPEQHEAMTQIPQPDAEPNSIVDVLEKGYALNGRLLRPARVVVSK